MDRPLLVSAPTRAVLDFVRTILGRAMSWSNAWRQSEYRVAQDLEIRRLLMSMELYSFVSELCRDIGRFTSQPMVRHV